MTLAWLDARAGLAGDMLCAALLDASGDAEALVAELHGVMVGLGLSGFTLRLSRVRRGVISGLHFDVVLANDGPAPMPAADARHHEHGHDHDHGHEHGHDHGHEHGHEHGRDWATIRGMILGSALPEAVKDRAVAAFGALAEAEARVHGVPVERVSFHEVGAVDSIIDMVGACYLLWRLGVESLTVSPLPLGGGTVQTAHGVLTVPVPATIELLRGFPVFQDGRRGELVTPTGAALARALGKPGPMPSMRPTATGYGAGTRNPEGWNNVTRLILGEPLRADESADVPADEVEVLSAQVDDMPGEALPGLLQALLQAGAADAFAAPVLMKKGRLGQLITAICAPDRAGAVGEALLRHSTSFGLRRHRAQREVLDRRHVPVQTPFGEVRVKLGGRGGELYQAKPEHDDCARLAEAAGVPLARVVEAALRALPNEERP